MTKSKNEYTIEFLRTLIHKIADSTYGQWEQEGYSHEARERFLNAAIDQIIVTASQMERER